MKKAIIASLGALGMFMVLTVITVKAQHQGTIKAKIPFEFTVGKKELPAGEYTIKLPAASGQSSRILVRSDGGKEALIVLTNSVNAKGMVEEPRLVFARYSGKYFLFQAFAPGTDIGQEVQVQKGVKGEQIARELITVPGRMNR